MIRQVSKEVGDGRSSDWPVESDSFLHIIRRIVFLAIAIAGLICLYLWLSCSPAKAFDIKEGCLECREKYPTLFFQSNGNVRVCYDEQKTETIPADDAKDILKFPSVNGQTVEIIEERTVSVAGKNCKIFNFMTESGRQLPLVMTCPK